MYGRYLGRPNRDFILIIALTFDIDVPSIIWYQGDSMKKCFFIILPYFPFHFPFKGEP
jgi:hypothetical protein